MKLNIDKMRKNLIRNYPDEITFTVNFYTGGANAAREKVERFHDKMVEKHGPTARILVISEAVEVGHQGVLKCKYYKS